MFCGHKETQGRRKGADIQLWCWICGTLIKPYTALAQGKSRVWQTTHTDKAASAFFGCLNQWHKPSFRKFEKPSLSQSTFRTTFIRTQTEGSTAVSSSSCCAPLAAVRWRVFDTAWGDRQWADPAITNSLCTKFNVNTNYPPNFAYQAAKCLCWSMERRKPEERRLLFFGGSAGLTWFWNHSIRLIFQCLLLFFSLIAARLVRESLVFLRSLELFHLNHFLDASWALVTSQN